MGRASGGGLLKIRGVIPARVAVVGWVLAAVLGPGTAWASAPTSTDLQQMSLDQLAQINVSSVSKTPEPLSSAPASIYVITHEAIVRSGAQSIPEMLRLAPNLEVFQTSASQYVISARGLSGDASYESFSNKLLVMIDGRSVYSPLYSGVYWDSLDVLPEDVDRIEVISGPGAALWGANAVNGVINIITRKAADTQGLYAGADQGVQQRALGLRYGGQAGDLSYRLYAHALGYDDTDLGDGRKDADTWSRVQGGFRADWAASATDSATLQGDTYRSVEESPGSPISVLQGANVLARWTHATDGLGDMQAQAYYDQSYRGTEDGGGDFGVNTLDLDVQDSVALNGANALVFGGGVRANHYWINGPTELQFAPSRGDLDLGDMFGQDTLSLPLALKLVLGLKVENDPYSGVSALPDARLSWSPGDDLLVWAAISRAIRSPTPFDETLVEKAGGATLLTGDPDFKPEKVTAYEIGVRAQPTARLSFSITGFYNSYLDLRDVAFAPSGVYPLSWGNGMRGDAFGLESWGDLRVTDWWRLSASVTTLTQQFHFAPGARALMDPDQDGDDPPHQAQLKSSMNLGSRVSFDAQLRYVDAMPDPANPAYVELNSRVAWDVTDHLQLGVAGFNLLHDRHQEYPGAEPIARDVVAELRWRY